MPYPGEIHFVYNNSALNQLAVLAIFMESNISRSETVDDNDRFFAENTRYEWQRFFNIAQTLQEEGNSTVFNLSLALLMGESLEHFWRYQGSLTTPPCTENVIWTVFRESIIFVESEFKSFRKNIYFEDYRRPQPLYTRKIYRNFLNESFSSIPDYNCCPEGNPHTLSTGKRSKNDVVFLYSVLIVVFCALGGFLLNE